MIYLPYPISTNVYWRISGKQMVISSEGKAYKRDAGWLYKISGKKILDGQVELLLVLHPRKTKDGTESLIRIDLDNALKCVCDSLNGIAYADDKQIRRIVAEIGNPIDGGGVSVKVIAI